MVKLDLGGAWLMKRSSDGRKFPCCVPGTACETLYKAGEIPDPYYRDNESKLQNMFRDDYSFSRSFTIGPELLKGRNIDLVCTGLDTIAEVRINGILAGTADNMHRIWRFPVKELLRAGENSIVISFSSPVKYIEQHKSRIGKRYSTIRKAACMYGWDWGIELPDCGIWREIYLEARDSGRIIGNVVHQEHGCNRAFVNVRPICIGAEDAVIDIELISPGGSEATSACVNDGEQAVLVIDNPELWQPRGYGKQPLYTLRTRLIENGAVTDERTEGLGLRTAVLDRSSCEGGSNYSFIVNGQPVFIRGENMIIPDALTGRIDKGTWQRLIDDALLSNLNALRVWGGAVYPPEEFFRLCDENGILVYMDMMFACSFYQSDARFLQNIRQELEDNLPRIANHPSVALFCGNNEIDAIYTVGGSKERETVALRKLFGSGEKPLPESVRQQLWGQYKPLFLELIPELIAKWAPDTSYIHSSPSVKEPGGAGSFFDYLSDGDMHYYLQYNNYAPYERMRSFRSRFMTEVGFQSYPDMETIESFTLPEDRFPYTPVMYAHQKCADGNEAIELYMSRDYAVPKDFSDYVFLSQIQAGEIMRYTAEHFRRDSGYCRGLILWQFNDCWPVVSWSGIDYYGRWKALQYYIRRFFEPLLVSAEDEGRRVKLWITNDTPETAEGTLSWSLHLGGKILKAGEKAVSVNAGDSASVEALDFSDILTDENLHGAYLSYSLKSDAKCTGGTVLFVKPKDFSFKKPTVSVKLRGDSVILSSDVFTKCVGISAGECVFSDNCFDLLPGEIRTVKVERGHLDEAQIKVNTLNGVLLKAGMDI